MADIMGTPKFQAFATDGTFLSGGLLYSYTAGTNTPLATYPTMADALAATNANTNPVVLDSRGEANVVLQGATKLVLKTSAGAQIWSFDNISQSAATIVDSYGNEVLAFTGVASAVNEITITNAAAGNSPIISTTGGDTNIDLKITPKGTGDTVLTTGDLTLTAGNIVLSTASATTSFLPAGTVVWKASTNVPTGWLECNGAAVSRTTYAALFADIGTVFGSGDGSSTFNLPTSARKVLVGKGGSGTATLANTVGSTGGAETHTLTTAEIPAHTHTTSIAASINDNSDVAGSRARKAGTPENLTSASTGGDGAHNNVQPSLVMMMIIRAY